ncbi:hypothetical protein C8R45DRAFT_1111743 [Mycena sanguinolenta]|nr:hypothetical protein C8R45DRAFT_1111743 [Mycena sanguinolenta]
MPTAAILQHRETEARKALARERRQSRVAQTAAGAAGLSVLPSVAPAVPQTAAAFPMLPGSPNPFYHGTHSPMDWQLGQLALMNQLYAFPRGLPQSTSSLAFNPEEEDELFADPDADLPGDPTSASASVVSEENNAPAAQMAPTTHNANGAEEQSVPQPGSQGVGSFTTPQNLPRAGEQSSPVAPIAGTPSTESFMTPQNYRAFPQATANMSSTDIMLPIPRRPLVRRAGIPTYTDLSSPSSPAPSPAPVGRQPLLHRTDIFGPGLHDNRQRPRLESPSVNAPSQKENAIHHLSDDESTEPAPLKKKPRKERSARSIVNVPADRIPIVEKAYEYIVLKVLSDKNRTWLQGRADLADLSQEAFDYGVDQLKLDPNNFGPVTGVEQDLCRERIYGGRKDIKEHARAAVAGPDGYGFLPCSAKATKEEQDRVAEANRKLVAELTDRSAFVYEDPTDRTIKGSMYKHSSITVLIRTALFANVLSMGMQHPEFFDDTLPEGHDETQLPHTPTFSLVTMALLITALRAAIMEYSSGHFLAEDFSRKVYKHHFEAELKTLREWREFTSRSTPIPGDGPVRMAPPTYMTRNLQQGIFAEARYNVLKNVVAPVPSLEVMTASDFALNQ